MTDYTQYLPDQNPALSDMQERTGMPEQELLVRQMVGKATTHAKGIKNTVRYIQANSPDVLEYVAALIEIRGFLGGLQKSKTSGLVPTFLILKGPELERHAHPMVRDLYLVCLNRIAELVFANGLQKKPKECAGFLALLIEQRVNLDINLARQSVVQSMLGADEAAALAWQLLLDLTANGNDSLYLPKTDSRYDELLPEEWRTDSLEHLGV